MADARNTITIDLDLNPSEAAQALLQYAETQHAVLAELQAIRGLLERLAPHGDAITTRPAQ